MNTVTLAGRLGADPELRDAGKTKACSLSLATKGYKKTEWHNVTCWGKTAEFVVQYLKKGDAVSVTGRVEYQSWEDKEGVKHYKTVINANQVESLERKKGDDIGI